MDVPIAANILGTIGAICWSVQLIPQIIINYRRHHTTGLQPSMMLLWASAGVPLGVYNITESFNIALRIQAQILTFLSLLTWSQCYYYGKHWSLIKCAVILVGMCTLMGGIEVALIFALKAAIKRHVTWPTTLMAVLAAVLLAAGVLRHYWDIYTHRTVRGISFIFVGIDAAGDLFSLVSVFFQTELNVLGMAIYGTELALWTGVFICGGYFNLLPWVKARVSTRRQRIENERQTQSQQGERGTIALHEMPSSTSVFMTPSSGLVERTATGNR
ncbi:hypothetical protein HO133_005373 [Letharia lupina]|uniref:PQ loop repeat protein n=1 Tax=Letharia lupina TaxID=560253 RepID=A0A8H6C8I8_9LECA|nr:uncharacterized protein HO133_005373 [Letharia lupina]KAF6218830.1 hypothetical protein HO133_005373 [Letharia lupina]